MECGLVRQLEGLNISVPVPLKSVKIEAKIVGFVSIIKVIQEYVNREYSPIEAEYNFPVEEEAAVIDFEAEVDGRLITAKVKEKDEAKAEYQRAVQASQTAFLLEETKQDIFQIKVGHLKPGAQALVTLTYLSELPVEQNAVRLTIPTTIAPKYIPPSDNSEAARKIADIKYTMDSPVPLKIEIEVKTEGRITSMTSPSHRLACKINNLVASAELVGAATEMDRDLVVLVESEDAHKPKVFLETNDEKGTSAAMVSLIPSFNLKEQPVELIFLVDRSGSMMGSSILQASRALEMFLHSMPASCLFNIFSFGSHFTSLFPHSAEYTDDTLAKAKSHVLAMDANYGGTEIHSPLHHIFKEPPKEGFSRQIFVLTDGAVSNDSQVIALVKRNANQARLFSLGLGNSCSRHLVKGISRAGNGSVAFASTSEDLRPKVLDLLKNSLQPSIQNISLKWLGDVITDEGLELKSPEVEEEKTLLGYMKPKVDKEIPLVGQAPLTIAPLFDGSRLLVYRLFGKKEQPTGVEMTAETPEGPLSAQIALNEHNQVKGFFMHQLAARKRIQDLEDSMLSYELQRSMGGSNAFRKAIITLGTEYNLASQYTSFVGVDPEAPEELFCGVKKRQVANQIPQGFGSPFQVSRSAYCQDTSKRSRSRGWSTRARSRSRSFERCEGRFMGSRTRSRSRSFERSEGRFKGSRTRSRSRSRSCERSRKRSSRLRTKSRTSRFIERSANIKIRSRSGSRYRKTPANPVISSPPYTFSEAFNAKRMSAQRSSFSQQGFQLGSINQTSAFGSCLNPPHLQQQQMSAQSASSFSQQEFQLGSINQTPTFGHGELFGAGLNPPLPLFSDSRELISDVIRTQTAKGIFKWSASVEKLLKLEEAMLDMKVTDNFDLWVTALVIAYLEVKCNKDKDLWELVANKARKVLSGDLGYEGMVQIIHEAKSFF